MVKKYKRLASLRPHRLAALIVILVMAGIGVSLLMRGHAASYGVNQEAEAGAITGMAGRCSSPDASAAASIKFGATVCNSTSVYSNPVLPGAADPGVIKWNNRYYMVFTTGDPTFPIYVSDDLVNWQPSGKSIFNGTHPWGKYSFWAPEIHRVGNRFGVYYSAFDGTNLRVGAAFADDILGPYTDLGKPLITASYGVIDVNFFRDDNGRQYVYWKEDGGETRIFGQEVDQNGSTFIGSKATVLQKGLDWEGDKGIEGPWMMKKNGTYYLFYSGELFSTDKYAVGVAKSSSPLGNFDKKGDPILHSGRDWIGPGHNSVVTVGANDYMVYHAYDNRETVRTRKSLVDKLMWVNGWPMIANGTGMPSQTPQPYPQ